MLYCLTNKYGNTTGFATTFFFLNDSTTSSRVLLSNGIFFFFESSSYDGTLLRDTQKNISITNKQIPIEAREIAIFILNSLFDLRQNIRITINKEALCNKGISRQPNQNAQSNSISHQLENKVITIKIIQKYYSQISS